MSNLWLIAGPILGGLISGAVGFGTQWLTDARRLKSTMRLFERGLIEDLKHFIAMSKRLEEDYRKSRIIYYNIINRIHESRGHYFRNRDFVTNISDETLRDAVQDFYRHTNDILTSLQGGQQRLDEIRRLIGERAQSLWNQDDSRSFEDIFELAENSMPVEVGERDAMNALIPQQLSELSEARTTAQRLIDKLSD